MNDIERAREQRRKLDNRATLQEVESLAAAAVNALDDDAAPERQIEALSVVVIGLADAHGVPREDLVRTFMGLINTLKVEVKL